MPQVYKFNNLTIYDVDKLQNFTESNRACKSFGSSLLRKTTLNYDTIFNKLTKVNNSNELLIYRISALNNETSNCFGTFDRSALVLNSESLVNVCRGDFEFEQNYFTFCEKTVNESVNESNNFVLIVLIIAFAVLGILAPVLFVCRKKIFARFYNVLVEEDGDRSSNHVGFVYLIQTTTLFFS